MSKVPRVLAIVGVSIGICVGPSHATPRADPDCPPVSKSRYRSVPEEADVAIAALSNYFGKHPPTPDSLVCAATVGYKPLEAGMRRRLLAEAVRLDPDENCRFEGGRVVYTAYGVWQVGERRYVADIHKLEFHDLSRLLGAFRYQVVRTPDGYTVEAEQRCNP